MSSFYFVAKICEQILITNLLLEGSVVQDNLSYLEIPFGTTNTPCSINGIDGEAVLIYYPSQDSVYTSVTATYYDYDSNRNEFYSKSVWSSVDSVPHKFDDIIDELLTIICGQ